MCHPASASVRLLVWAVPQRLPPSHPSHSVLPSEAGTVKPSADPPRLACVLLFFPFNLIHASAAAAGRETAFNTCLRCWISAHGHAWNSILRLLGYLMWHIWKTSLLENLCNFLWELRLEFQKIIQMLGCGGALPLYLHIYLDKIIKILEKKGSKNRWLIWSQWIVEME